MATLNLVLGIYDDPENQSQEKYSIDLYRNNIAVFGSAMSGKTTLLKTILVHLHYELKNTEKECIYILDFSNNLQDYEQLPYVLAYFAASNEENVRRLFLMMDEKLSDNAKILNGKNYIEADEDDERPAHITLILDGLNSFFSQNRYNKYHETLIKISREGISKGITVIFTANEAVGGINRLLPHFNRKIAFDLPKERYFELFSVGVDKPIVLQGRGIANIESNTYEFQGCLPFRSIGKKDEAEGIKALQSKLKELGVDLDSWNDKKQKSFNGDLNIDNWNNYTKTLHAKSNYLIAGLDYYTFEPCELELRKAQSIAIYGNKQSGKSNLLSLILSGVIGTSDSGLRLVFWDDKRNGLSEVYNRIPNEQDNYRTGRYKVVLHSQADFEDYIIKQGYYDLNEDFDSFFKYQNPDIGMSEDSEMNIENTILPHDFPMAPPLSPGFMPPIIPKVTNLTPYKKSDNPFTIFIIQDRAFYHSTSRGRLGHILPRLTSFIRKADEYNCLFIFSDAQRISDLDLRNEFNDSINHAFLMYDIFRFINERGKGTVFDTRDLTELKETFGPCEEKGDGFYFNLETDELQKIKFLKSW